jgi:uncharacterized cofD-like protein
MHNKKNVVIISGGNGSAISINACKTFLHDINLSAVIPMSDSGGSTGRLRREFDVLPVGDIMRAVVAMSKYDAQLLKQIFYRTRFDNVGKLDKHNLGNIFLVLAQQYDGDFLHSLTALHQAVAAVGTVHPVSLDISDLAVEYTNGETVVGEHKIDRPEKRDTRIARAWLEPKPPLYGEAKRATEEADVIIFGPGSLYCSIIPSLLVGDMQEILRTSKAKFIYVVGNAYELNGEAGPGKLSEFISELENYLPRKLDAVVYNNHKLSSEEEKRYEEKKWGYIESDQENVTDRLIISDDFERQCRLDPEKLGNILEKIIKS